MGQSQKLKPKLYSCCTQQYKEEKVNEMELKSKNKPDKCDLQYARESMKVVDASERRRCKGRTTNRVTVQQFVFL